MSRSNHDKPFYVDIGISIVAIRCASNGDTVAQYDNIRHPTKAMGLAEDVCDRMNREVEIFRPLRNCDVGTADEQAERFYSFCKTHQSGIQGMCSSQCPCQDCCDTCHCLTKWSQMPYEEGGANDYSHNQRANGND